MKYIARLFWFSLAFCISANAAVQLSQVINDGKQPQSSFVIGAKAGSWEQLPMYNWGAGICSFTQWANDNAIILTPFSEQSDHINNAALDCQIKFYQNYNYALSNIFGRNNLQFYIEGELYDLKNPVSCVEGLTCHDEAKLYRDNSSSPTGNCTDYYWDGSACNGLHNVFQPMMIVHDGASIDDASLYAKNLDGTNKGSGIAQGFTWGIVGCAVGSPGSGYTNGDQPLGLNPSHIGSRPKVTLTVVGGTVTGCAMAAGNGTQFSSLNGEYTIPPAKLKTQASNPAFIAATGITMWDSSYGDGTTAIATTGGTGTGFSFVPVWAPQWGNGSNGLASSSTPAYKFAPGAQDRKLVRQVHVYDALTTVGDSTWGDATGMWIAGPNSDIHYNWVQGSGVAYDVENSDVRGFGNYTNFSSYGLRFRSADFDWQQFEIDSPIIACGILDNVQGNSHIDGKCYENGSSSSLTGAAAWLIGLNGSSTSGVVGLDLSMNYENLGKPIFSLDYLKGGNRLAFAVNNYNINNSTYANQITGVAIWGTHFLAGSGNRLDGVYDNITTPFSGTAPSSVWCSIMSGNLGREIGCSGDTNIAQVLSGGNSATAQTANSTVYCGLSTVNACSSSAGNRRAESPRTGVLRNLYAIATSAPAGTETDVVTVRVNGSDTALTCTITGIATTCNDTTDTVQIAAGQTNELKITLSTSAASSAFIWGVEFDSQ